MEDVTPSLSFLSPRALARGLPGDAVPKEVKDASLSLGITKYRGGFLKQPSGNLDI